MSYFPFSFRGSAAIHLHQIHVAFETKERLSAVHIESLIAVFLTCPRQYKWVEMAAEW